MSNPPSGKAKQKSDQEIDKVDSSNQSRSLLPLLLGLLVVFFGMKLIAPKVDPIRCGVDVQRAQAQVMMLSAEWCGYCKRARRFFVNNEVNYCEYDIEKTPTGRELYARSGIVTIPVIYAGNATLTGFDRRRVLAVLEKEGLYLARAND